MLVVKKEKLHLFSLLLIFIALKWILRKEVAQFALLSQRDQTTEFK